MILKRTVLLTLLTGCLFPMVATGFAKPMTKHQKKLYHQESGFLGPMYSKLHPDSTNGDWLIYFRTRDVMRTPHTFWVEPVKIYLLREARRREIPPEELHKLSEHFTQAIKDQLAEGHYRLADGPGPGVMKLRFAITNVQPNGNKRNMIATGAEEATLYGAAPMGSGMLIPRLSVGKVSIEGEMVDSQTGTVEMAFMTARSGRRFFSGLKAFQKWGDIDAAFKGWAKNFRKRLDKAHAG
jgi:hypothetical protein